MPKFQIFPDGRAAGSAPVSGSDFVNLDYLSGSLPEKVWIRGTGQNSAVLSGSSNSEASSQYAVAHGSIVTASGFTSHAEGVSTAATEIGTHAEGSASKASGQYSHVEGIRTVASAQAAHAEGMLTVASAQAAHAEGSSSHARGMFSHAEGIQTVASGSYSHAEGYATVASGSYAHAEGSGSKTYRQGAHAEGYRTEAIGMFSHTEGSGSKAEGQYSHAEGEGTLTSNDFEHAQGRYNATASGQIFSVGGGASPSERVNALSIVKVGDSRKTYVYGVGTYNGTNPTPGTNDIATVINSLTGSIASASYSSTDKKIYFYNAGGTAVANVDATDFIKDGMVDTVTVNTGSGQMIITFNTDAGKEDINLNLTDIFNPNNYYTKTDVNTLLTTMSVGDVNVIEAIEFNGTASSISGKTASINVELPAAPNQEAENWVTENSASILTESIWVRGTGSGSAQLKNNWVTASGLESVAYGYLGWTGGDGDTRTSTVASGPYSHAEGLAVSAIGTGSHAEGSWSFAQGEVSHAEGIFSHAYGNGSHAEGRGSAYGHCSHAEGNSIANGSYSHAEGVSSTATGSYSHAEGSKSLASGFAAHAEGSRTTASGWYSHTEGTGSMATEFAAHAEGWATTASGYASHAEGCSTYTSGNYSHAEGAYTKVLLEHYAHAEGYGTVASGRGAHTEGYYTSASGQASHAEGSGSWARNTAEHAQGKYNATASSQIFSIGVGSGNTDRKNAISVITGSNPSASVYIYGVGGYVGNNPVPGTNDLATVISNISASSGGGGITAETDPIYLADSASLKNAATWVGSNSASTATAISNSHTHSNKTVLDGITAAKTASWEASGTLAKNLTAISASLIASGTLAKNVTAITASLVASASVAKTASSSAAAISAKTGSYDALQGLPAVTAADNGKILRVVNGAWALVDPVTVYSGQGAPDSALGQDGDIYLQS